MASGIISWRSQAQKTIALSSTEAEYMALSDASRQAIWYDNLLEEISYDLKPISLTEDNQGSIFMASNTVQEIQSKHIDIRYHYVQECIEQCKIEVSFIEGVL